jgi:hypothetical protein
MPDDGRVQKFLSPMRSAARFLPDQVTERQVHVRERERRSWRQVAVAPNVTILFGP